MLPYFDKVYDPFYKTPEQLLWQQLKCLELKDGDVLMDLGCGDARGLIMGCSIANISCIGFEHQADVRAIAQQKIDEAGLTDRIELRSDDFYEANLSEATAIICYLSRGVLGHLSLKLEQELNAGTRIVTHTFDIPAWTAESDLMVGEVPGSHQLIHLYKKR